MRRLSWDQVRARRLARSHLAERAPRDRLVDVVRDVGGLQAQILVAAEIGLGIRVESVTQPEIRRELWETRTLAKTWTLRGTLHLVPADELTLWTAAARAVDAQWFARWELDAKQADAVLAALREALDGRALERQELADEVGARLGARLHERMLSMWGDLVSLGTYAGIVCFGPNRGAKVTFVRVDQWVADRPEVEPRAALMEACRRYIAAYGPAVPRSFARWFGNGLKPAAAQELFASLVDELEEVDVEGERAWLLSGDDGVDGGRSLRLVPQYDAYVMGFRERERFVPEAAKAAMGAAGSPWLLVDGAIAGTWTRAKRGRRIELEVAPFRHLSRARRAELDTEAARIGQLLGGDLSLKVT